MAENVLIFFEQNQIVDNCLFKRKEKKRKKNEPCLQSLRICECRSSNISLALSLTPDVGEVAQIFLYAYIFFSLCSVNRSLITGLLL